MRHLNSIHTLRGECIEYIEERFSSVAQTAGFLELDATTLMTIAFDDNLKVDNERTVYDAVIRWGTIVSDPQPQSSTSVSTDWASPEVRPYAANYIWF